MHNTFYFVRPFFQVIFCLLLAVSPLAAQTAFNFCEAMTLEGGVLDPNVWQGEWGKRKVNSDCIVTYTEVNFGLHPAHHRVRSASEGNLVAEDFVCDNISYTPPGKPYAIQLGSDYGKYRYEKLKTSFLVEPGSSLIQIQFAVVLYDPNDHETCQKPKFQFEVRDAGGNTIPCGQYVVYAGGNIPGFQNCGNVRYRDWTTASIDLRDYIGTEVTLEFGTYNCGKGKADHYAVALFTVECLPNTISTVGTYCPGVSDQIQLAAPPGFTNYQWSTGQTGQTVTISNPTPGNTVSVSFLPYSSLDASCSLTLEYEIPTSGPFQMPQQVEFCTGGSTIVTPITPPGFDYYQWSNGAQTPSIIISGPGTYTVTVTEETGQCVLSASVTATTIPLLSASLSADSVVCPWQTNTLILNVAGAQPTGMAWLHSSLGDVYEVPFSSGMGSLDFLPANTLTLSIDSILLPGYACPFVYAPGEVPVRVDWVAVDAVIETFIQCPGYTNGVVEAYPAQGTPPFDYLWAQGQNSAHLEALPAGLYTLTITDRHSCTAVDSIQLIDPPRLEYALQVASPLCFNDWDSGSIAVSQVTNAQTADVFFYVDDDPTPAPGVLDGLTPGTYTLQVADGLCAVDTTVVLVAPPELTISLPAYPDVLEFGDSIRLVPITNIPAWDFIQWQGQTLFNQPEDLAPWARPFRSGPVQVTVVTHEGCLLTAQSFLKVDQNRQVYTPNCFSPNDDGVNDWFFIFPKPGATNVIRRLAVYDRQGAMLWQSVENLSPPFDESMGWDGQHRGKLCTPGVYVWKAEIEYIDGFLEILEGDLTLLAQ